MHSLVWKWTKKKPKTCCGSKVTAALTALDVSLINVAVACAWLSFHYNCTFDIFIISSSSSRQHRKQPWRNMKIFYFCKNISKLAYLHIVLFTLLPFIFAYTPCKANRHTHTHTDTSTNVSLLTTLCCNMSCSAATLTLQFLFRTFVFWDDSFGSWVNFWFCIFNL